MTLETLTVFSTSAIVGSGAALLLGWYLIRGPRRITWHRNAMLTAGGLALVFLAAYLTRWGLYGSKPFEGTGGWRVLYLSILVPHILLAMAVVPLALRLVYLALKKKDFAAHRRLARVTLPIWLFVAASGWAIYFLLYRMSY